MHAPPLNIPEIKLLTPKIFRDHRGFFSETYNLRTMKEAGIDAIFVQDNHSLSAEPGTIRGLHFQTPPHAQDKLIRVTRGAILDVAVDIRNGSPTFGQHVAVQISAENWQQLWIPKGFAHGFCTLKPNTEVLYKTTAYFDQSCDKGLAWDDPDLNIEWPVSPDRVKLSDKDRRHPRLSELPHYFSL